MSVSNYQFIQTRNMFREYLSRYSKNPSYYEWKNADPDDKASLLFVTFFKEITLAWDKAVVSCGIVYISQDDAVSTVLQYLMKNVSKINSDENRYTANYIYQICYNCLLSLWRTRGTERQRCGCEISNEYTEGGVAVNLWDLVPSEDDDIETKQTKEAFWTVIHHMGPKAEKVVNHIINPDDTLHKISQSSSERPIDRLADVSVSKKEYEEIIAELRVQLMPYKDLLLHF